LGVNSPQLARQGLHTFSHEDEPALLYTWRTRQVGFGPRAVNMGGCLRYRRADLDAWIVEHLEPAEGE
jgi:hypothetical protein